MQPLAVEAQAVQAPDEDGVRPVERQLMDAARLLAEERLEMRPGRHCERCDFRILCPTQTAGTVLS